MLAVQNTTRVHAPAGTKRFFGSSSIYASEDSR